MGLSPRVWTERFEGLKYRLREPLWWYPYPAFIAGGLVLFLTSHLIFSVNSRAGHPADVISFPSEERKDGPIWISVAPIDGDIVVTTADRRVFRWKQDVRSTADLKPFVSYLKETVQHEIQAAALAKKAFAHQTNAVIAADQRLKYLHVRPLLYALAEAGISQYAFETQNPHLAIDGDHAEPTHHAVQSLKQYDRM